MDSMAIAEVPQVVKVAFPKPSLGNVFQIHSYFFKRLGKHDFTRSLHQADPCFGMYDGSQSLRSQRFSELLFQNPSLGNVLKIQSPLRLFGLPNFVAAKRTALLFDMLATILPEVE